MKKLSFIIVLFSTCMQAQQTFSTYTEKWKEVDLLELDNLTKSANDKVENIYQLAKKEQNSPQIIKSLLYQSKYAMILEEDAQYNVVKRLENEISTATFPTKNLLESILANLYWQYFQENRWRFYNRTETAQKVNSDDFRTWDINTLFREIQKHYDNSLQNENQLQSIAAKKFESILIIGTDDDKYRPTLYDFLVHQALGFYKTDEKNLSKPTNQFLIDQKSYLSNYKQFVALKLATQDSLSAQFKALQYYQDLIRFHQNDPQPDALILADIDRLRFVYEQAAFLEKDNVLLETFVETNKQFLNHESGTLYDFEIAQHYRKQGSHYNPSTNLAPQFLLQKSVDVCNEAIRRFPQSYGAKRSENLKLEILNPDFNLKIEEYIPENKPSLIFINYKNIDILNFKAFKINEEQSKKLSEIYNEDKRLSYINELISVKNWTQKLINENDYQFHTTEVLLPGFTHGRYLILAQVPQLEIYGYAIVQITDLVLTEIKNSQEHRLQLVHRMNGKPIKGANIHLKSRDNNKYVRPFNKKYTTDTHGFVYLPKDNNYNYLQAKVTYRNQMATFGNYSINLPYEDNSNRETYHQVAVFTDRSIYRPSQKVYFKALVFENKPMGKKTISKVMPNQKVTAELYDVNWQKVANLELITNEFGTVTGEFYLPNTGLTGVFNLQVKANNDKIIGSTNFSVEEYKRPKFEAQFKPVTETYKVNDPIKVTGIAQAFAGTNISDAQVVYRVRRKIQYPQWRYWRMPFQRAETQEIKHGKTVTDTNGEFHIVFTAIPDQSVDAKTLPIFQYEIEADVTDLNGETHTAKTIVNVGYQSMMATMNVDANWQTDKDQPSINIVTQNLNGEKVPSKGVIKIYKLQFPNTVKRNRPWQEVPDYVQWTEEEFHKLFPFEYYLTPNFTEKQKLGDKVYEAFYTAEMGEATLNIKKDLKKWEGGLYQIVLETQDNFGNQIIEKANFNLIQPKSKQVADKQLFSVNLNQSSYTAGETALLTVGTASPEAHFFVYVEKDRKIVQTIPLVLCNEVKTLEFPITENDISGFSILTTMVNINSYHSKSTPVNVHEKIENLSIETTTFRDKMQPGSPQTWSFTIKGLKKDQKVAEILAGMYDASLDQFKPHQWNLPNVFQPVYWSSLSAQAYTSFNQKHFYRFKYPKTAIYDALKLNFYHLNWFGFSFGYYKSVYMMDNAMAMPKLVKKTGDSLAIIEEEEVAAPAAEASIGNDKAKKIKEDSIVRDFSDIKIRTNFNETAFFYPQIKTDTEGNFTFSFTSPEALTRWKLQLLGHTRNMQTAYYQSTSVTQKELMLLPNAPRFLREGDEIIFSTKISNLSENALNGMAMLELTDAVTQKNIDVKLSNFNTTRGFQINAKGNTSVSWTLKIPFDVQAVQYKIVAKAGDFSDGEQNVLPVLSNRMLVTETLPMWINSNETKTFTLDKLKNNTSTTLQNHKLTLEVTSNPIWYAIQALPYLMEFPYECSEQTFSRYYANALATKIVKENPAIAKVFHQWENTGVLMSNLEQNEELKSLLIAETPWLRDAQSETEQQKRIALLFDLQKMTHELEKSAQKLYDMQFPDGGFPWFKGSRYPDRYITQHIAAGFGHLEKLGVFPLPNKDLINFDEGKKTHKMLVNAVQFLDANIIKDYEYLEKQAKIIREKNKNTKQGQKEAADFMKANHLGPLQLHYLYMRTFYSEVPKTERLQQVVDYYTKLAAQYWKENTLYQKGLIAMVLHRSNQKPKAQAIVKSLGENSITHPELGMYWKEKKAGWNWYEAPIETQALLIEAFAEVEPNQNQLDLMKFWLLKNKQTNSWGTTKSTTVAIFALLAYGTDLTVSEKFVDVKVGNETIIPTPTQAGSGYFKTSWNGQDIQPAQANVTLTKSDKGIAWGGLYWQYFENLDKITFATTPLQLSKKLFLKQNTDTGEKLIEIKDGISIKVGDLVRVRIELKVDRDIEFVHMKDMRASGFEPVNVLSQYKYQDGLGYYESTKDAATNFFFDRLSRGVYVFEYNLRANNAGHFSNGITTIQCMYAPEFTSHSQGVKVEIIK